MYWEFGVFYVVYMVFETGSFYVSQTILKLCSLGWLYLKSSQILRGQGVPLHLTQGSSNNKRGLSHVDIITEHTSIIHEIKIRRVKVLLTCGPEDMRSSNMRKTEWALESVLDQLTSP